MDSRTKLINETIERIQDSNNFDQGIYPFCVLGFMEIYLSSTEVEELFTKSQYDEISYRFSSDKDQAIAMLIKLRDEGVVDWDAISKFARPESMYSYAPQKGNIALETISFDFKDQNIELPSLFYTVST